MDRMVTWQWRGKETKMLVLYLSTHLITGASPKIHCMLFETKAMNESLQFDNNPQESSDALH